MELDLLDLPTLLKMSGILLLMVISAAHGYAAGHKQGHREGYRFGRSIRTNRTICTQCMTSKVGA